MPGKLYFLGLTILNIDSKFGESVSSNFHMMWLANR